jgi:hypothetical protein
MWRRVVLSIARETYIMLDKAARTQNIGARRHIPEVGNIRLQIANVCQVWKSVDGYKTGSVYEWRYGNCLPTWWRTYDVRGLEFNEWMLPFSYL